MEIITDKEVQVTGGGKKQVKVTGGDTIDITRARKFTAKSGNEMQINADKKLETESNL